MKRRLVDFSLHVYDGRASALVLMKSGWYFCPSDTVFVRRTKHHWPVPFYLVIRTPSKLTLESDRIRLPNACVVPFRDIRTEVVYFEWKF